MLTNFGTLATPTLARLEGCFAEVYDNNMKGKVFEEESRKLLRNRRFTAYPERMSVNERKLPETVSLAILGASRKKQI